MADRDPVGAGEAITYTLSFTGSGGPARGVSVEATVPQGATFEAASPAPEIDPGPGGGGGLVRWSVPDLPADGGGTVSLTVRVDDGTAPRSPIVLADYAVNSEVPPASAVGTEVVVTVEEDLWLRLLKTDEPDGVEPGGTLTYTLVVSNSGQLALNDVVVRELFDANFVVDSALPAADVGTIDRWSFPFLPVGASQTIVITGRVRDTAVAGTLIQNVATAIDGEGRFAEVREDTRVVENAGLSITVDDVPDPVGEGENVVYAITVANLSGQALSGATVQASADPALSLDFASPPPDAGTGLAWTLGSLPAGASSRIFVSMKPGASRLYDGDVLSLRAWISSPGGPTASATELTRFSSGDQGPPFVLTVTGAPRNLRIGVVTTAVYTIKIRYIGAAPARNVTVTNALPTGLDFVESAPAPSSRDGQVLTYRFPTMAPGAIRLIVVKAELGDDAVAGMGLTNTTTLSDDGGYSAQATLGGSVRGSGSDPASGKLSVSLVTVKRVVAGSKLASTISVSNGGRGDAENVVVTLDGPVGITLLADQTIPPPTKTEQVNGLPRWTWVFARMKGPGNLSIKTRHSVPEAFPAGSVLTFRASVTAADGRSDTETKTVEVRN